MTSIQRVFLSIVVSVLVTAGFLPLAVADCEPSLLGTPCPSEEPEPESPPPSQEPSSTRTPRQYPDQVEPTAQPTLPPDVTLESEGTTQPLPGIEPGDVIRSVATDQRMIALTLDDGYEVDEDIMDMLETWELRGTAFIVGSVADANPEFVARLARMGWEVCSHTYNHRRLTHLSDETIEREIVSGMRAVERAAGHSCPYFRAPGGFVNSRVLRVTDRLGLKIVHWDASLSDITTVGKDPWIQADIAFKHIRPGTILLGHFGAVNSYIVLRKVLTATLAAGYHVGTVTELLEAKGDDGLGGQDDSALGASARSGPKALSPFDTPARRATWTDGTVVRVSGAVAAIVVLLLLFGVRRRRHALAESAQE